MAKNVTDINTVSQIKPIKASGLTALVNQYNGLTAGVSSAQGACGDLIKKAEKSHGINAQAFKTCATLSRKDTLKRQDFLMTFDALRDQLGWDDEDQKDMIEMSRDEDKVVPMNGQDEAAAEESTPA